MVTVALFAFQLGLDNNPEWGERRFQIAGLGILVIFWGLSYWLMPLISRRLFSAVSGLIFLSEKFKLEKITAWPFFQFIRQSGCFQAFLRHGKNIFLVFLVIFAFWSYLWISTTGRLDQWPSGKNYYNLLAQAFQRGQLHLLLEPAPELLSLENPYDFRSRENISYLWDASLYQGKYYLYWGPVPGLIGMLFSALTLRPVTDAGIVFVFLVMAAIFSVLLFKGVSQDFKFPSWLFWGAVISLLFNVPVFWLLARPSVYEASIAGGQAFAMAGLYFGYMALRQPLVNNRYLFLTGLMLGLAGGTRINLLVSGAAIALLIGGYLFFRYARQLRDIVPALLALGLPLVTVFTSLLLYNYARFGNVFEFGHRYQLTGLALPANYQNVSSTQYILPNAFTYFIRMPALSSGFPFITIPWIKEQMWPSFLHLPENYYYSEPTAGILFIVPVIGFAFLILLRLLWLFLDGEINFVSKKQQGASKLILWLLFSLIATVVTQMSILLVFISASLRYLFDITPSAIILSGIFVGINLGTVAKKAYQKKLLGFSWVFISLLTAISGVLVGLTGPANHFAKINPHLFEQILGWFR